MKLGMGRIALVAGVIGCLLPASIIPVTLTFQDVYFSKVQNKLLTGTYPATAEIYSDRSRVFRESFSGLVFQNGTFRLILGRTVSLNATVLNNVSMNLVLQLQNERATFPITTVPYAVRSQTAEFAKAIDASVVKGSFTSTFNANGGLQVLTSANANLLSVKNRRVSIGTTPPTTNSLLLLNIGGVANATDYRVRGVPLATALSGALLWKQSVANTSNLYIMPAGFIGINTTLPFFGLHVSGTVNAKALVIRGNKLSSSLDWKRGGLASANIYYQNLTSRVGIGTAVPSQLLDVAGALRIGISQRTNTGTIRWNGFGFEGYSTTRNQSGWVTLSGVDGGGNINKAALWSGQNLQTVSNNLTSITHFYFSPTANAVGLGAPHDAKLSLVAFDTTTPLLKISSNNTPNVLVVTATGNIGIGTSKPRSKMDVKGFVDAQDYTINGEILRLSFSINDIWTRNPTSRSIYYSVANVGIGLPNPTSLLEIAQPTGLPGTDPAVTVSNLKTGANFTFGVSTKSQQTFRIEKGTSLGKASPLFIAQQDRFGIGVDPPKANLNVSGNSGVIFSGQFNTTTASVAVSGPGTRAIWIPSRAAFRAGVVDQTSSVGGADWDAPNIGRYTVSFGHNTMVSGNISTVVGGANNSVGGAYSTVLGGSSNKISSDFSWAAGQNTTLGWHGGFVWGDTQRTSMNSIVERQFLIRAGGGVGIGTTTPQQSGLSILRNLPTGNILTLYGNGKKAFQLLSGGAKVLLGSTGSSSNAKLAIMNGRALFGTPTTQAQVTIQPPSKTNYLFMVIGREGVTSPSFVVTGTQNVGLGLYPNPRLVDSSSNSQTPQSGFLQLAGGSIKATVYEFPDGQKISTSAPNFVWQYKTTTPNIYFVSGNVGIGTTTPRSLLHLSDTGSISFGTPLDPAITFDIDDTNRYTLGVSRSSPTVFKIKSGASLSGSAPFNVVGNYVGIHTEAPSTNLHVVGTVILPQTLGVGTTASGYTLNTKPMVAASKFFLRGNVISAGGTPWIPFSNPDRIYYDTVFDPQAHINSFVGFGTTQPKAEVDVAGTLNITAASDQPSVRISKELQIFNSATLLNLYFRDQSGSDISNLYVKNGRLFLEGSDLKSVSDVFSRGRGEGGSVAVWAAGASFLNFATLTESDMFWKSPTGNAAGIWSVTGNLITDNQATDSSGYTYSHRIDFGGQLTPTYLSISSLVDHNGLLSNSRSYTSAKISGIFDSWNALSSQKFTTRGLSIRMAQPKTNFFTLNGTAIGLNVDTTGIAVQSVGDKGYAYPAIFMSGATQNVGINITPNAALDVKGTVFATSFNISNQLSITTINVANSISILQAGKVGFGTTSPQGLLDIRGGIQSTYATTHGLNAQSLGVKSNSFVVTPTGLVGIGTTDPQAELHFSRTFTGIRSQPFSFENLGITLNVGGSSGTPQTFGKSLSGISLVLQSSNPQGLSATPNLLGSVDGTAQVATGVKINLSNLILDSTANVGTALYVAVPTYSSTAKSFAALFQGGNVGIGTTTPSTNLYVVGTVKANNAPAARLLAQQEGASFNYLVIRSTAGPSLSTPNLLVTGPVNAENMRVQRISYSNLVVKSPLNLFQRGLYVPGTIISSAVSANAITANAGTGKSTIVQGTVQLTALSVGQSSIPSAGVVVNGITAAKHITVTSALYPNAVSGNTTLHITAGNGVGIGTTQPNAPMDIRMAPYKTGLSPLTFSASDNRTWNTILAHTKSSVAGHAASLLFVPDIDETSATIGSGIAAVRESSATGSYMVFITDPSSGSPTERLRIQSTGNIGIGLTNPRSLLHVSGNVLVRNNLTPTLKVFATKLIGKQNLVTSTLNIPVRFVVSGNLLTDKAALLTPMLPPTPTSSYSILHVRSSNNNLYYTTYLADGSVTSGNLSVTVSAGSTTLPYFKSTHSLGDSMDLKWSTSSVSTVLYGKLRVATASASTLSSGHQKVSVLALISTANQTSNLSLMRVRLGLGDRSNASSSLFTGTDIRVKGGALTTNETATGLKVQLDSALKDSGTTTTGGATKGTKITAFFLAGTDTSGNVGIATSSNSSLSFSPSANLHIAAQASLQDAFIVESKDVQGTHNALWISSSGLVGVGMSSPDSKFSIKTQSTSGSDFAFSALDGAGKSLVALDNSGRFGIGTATPSAQLDVRGTLKAPTLIAGTIGGSTLRISTPNGGLTVLPSGVGIGTSAPTAWLHIYKAIPKPANLTSNFILNPIKLEHNTLLTTGISGLGIKTESDSRSVVGAASGLGNTVKGLSIDLTGVQLSTGSVGTGIFSNVSPTPTDTRYSAVFLGGRVGIGTSEPAVALDIKGELRARNLVATVSLNIDSVSVNRMVVLNQSVLNTAYMTRQTPSIRQLTIQNAVSVNLVQSAGKKLLTAGIMSAGVVTVNRNVLIGGITSATQALYVSGNATAKGLFVSGNVGAAKITMTGTGEWRASQLFWNTPSWTVSGNLAAKTLKLAPFSTTTQVVGHSLLFVDSDHSNALVLNNGGTEANLSGKLGGEYTKVPFYDSSSDLNSLAPVYWIPSSNYRGFGVGLHRFKVGTESVQSTVSGGGTSRLEVLSGVGTKNVTTATAASLFLTFPARETEVSSSPVFTGANLYMEGSNGGEERTVGLSVDMRTLKSRSSTNLPIQEDSPIIAKKYAALFISGKDSSGNVLIMTNPASGVYRRPSADLHVISQVPNKPAFWVDTYISSTQNSLLVTDNAWVGIGTSSPKHRMVIRSSAATESAVAIENASGASLFHITGTGKIGVGTSTPVGMLSIRNTVPTRSTLWMETIPSLNHNKRVQVPLAIDGLGKVGIGLSNPGASLHLFMDPDNYRFRSSLQYNVYYANEVKNGPTDTPSGLSLIPVDGLLDERPTTENGKDLYLGMDTPNKLVEEIIYSNGNPYSLGRVATLNPRIDVLRVSSVPVKRSLVVSYKGLVGVGVAANTILPLTVSRSILSGTLKSGVLPPLLYTTSPGGRLGQGIVTDIDDSFSFFGIQKTRATTYKKRHAPLLLFGKSSDTNLVFETGAGTSKEVMRFTSAGRIGIGQTTPVAQVHIKTGVTSNALQLDGLTKSNILKITPGGSLGILNANPKTMVSVSGNLFATHIVNSPGLGTTLIGKDLYVTLSDNRYTASTNFWIQPILKTNVAFTANDIGMVVKKDIANDVTGMYVTMDGKIVHDLTSYTKHHYGVRVKIDPDFNTQDPTFHSFTGKKVAATFMGGSVGIGVIPTGNLLTINSTNYRWPTALQVNAMNIRGVNTSTGNIAAFETDTGSRLTMSYFGTMNLRSILSPFAFVAAGLTEAESISVWNDLYANNKLVVGNGNGTAGNYALASNFDISAYNSPLSNAKDVIVRSVLTAIASKHVFQLKDQSIANQNTGKMSSIVLLSGATDVAATNNSSIQVGRVGMGFPSINATALSAIDATLVVSGSIRVGVTKNVASVSGPGIGNRLYFSGSTSVGAANDSENSDIYWMGRYNAADQASELRLGIGDKNTDNPNSTFALGVVKAGVSGDGYMQWGTANTLIRVGGYVDPVLLEASKALSPNGNPSLPKTEKGFVGIATSNVAADATTLHVKGGTNLNSLASSNYLMVIDNTMPAADTNPRKTLAITMASPPTGSYYIAFMVPSPSASDTSNLGGKKIIGGFKMSGGVPTASAHFASVTFTSSEADYAEFIPKQDPFEKLEPTDVVGITNGQVSKDTQHAQQVMVMSSAPIIMGNWSSQSTANALVAFLGQVLVKVRGSVRSGDYLKASGLSDGVATAISEQDLTLSDIPLLIGRAWESSANPGVKKINAAVGLTAFPKALADRLHTYRTLQAQLEEEKQFNATLKKRYDSASDNREALIRQLKARIAKTWK